MEPVEGYSGKVVDQTPTELFFECGSRHKATNAPLNCIGKWVMVDKHGNWWVKQ